MYRKFYQTLLEWDHNKKRKPLLVIGARQVGKTYLIEQFCKDTYEDCFTINLERQKEYISAFEGDLSPETILRNLEQLSGRRIDERCTIFIDEIQQSERAITSLKYFCEAPEDYRIIGAGSLLGVKLSRFEASFPVGKVQLCYMHPMDFEEFLIACEEEPLRDGILEACKTSRALVQGVHEKALRLYRDYIFIGGMPEMVSAYKENDGRISAVDDTLYDALQTAYLADMTRYTRSPAEGVKITDVYQSVPRQLARENPKFKYKEIRPYANKRDFSSSVDWLIASGLVISVGKVDLPKPPLQGYADSGSCKLYLSDIGILRHTTGLKMRDMLPETHNIYKGAVTENYVVQQLSASGYRLYYYKPSASMEIDLVLDTEDGIIPIEIKSGRHKRSTSLKNYCEKYRPPYAIRISELNFGEAGGLRSLPLYAAWCIGEKRSVED